MTMVAVALDAVALRAAVTACGLPGVEPAAEQPLDPGTWTAVMAAAHEHRLHGLLAHAIAEGLLPVTPDQAAEAADRHRAALSSCVHLEVVLQRAARALGRAGVQFRVLKGPAHARLDYPDPAMRTFGDIDLLVRAADYPAALRALQAGGFTRTLPPVHPTFDREWTKGATLESDDGWELDVHRTLAAGRFGLTIDLDELLSTGQPFRVGDVELTALTPAARLVHACYHVTLGGNLRWVSHRDIAQLVLDPALDLTEPVDLARHWRGEAVLAAGLVQAWEALGLTCDHPLLEWARALRAPADQAAALATYRSDPSFRAQALTALPVLPSLRAKARYLGSLAFPSDEHLHARHRSRPRQVVDALAAELRRRRAR